MEGGGKGTSFLFAMKTSPEGRYTLYIDEVSGPAVAFKLL